MAAVHDIAVVLHSRALRMAVFAVALVLVAAAVRGSQPVSADSTLDTALGTHHSCVLISGGAQCWGQGFNGQLGNGLMVSSTTPVAVSGAPPLTAIAAGDYHTCGLTQRGGVQCWGLNLLGQLGDGTLEDRGNPDFVIGLDQGVVQLEAQHLRTCARFGDGEVQCWGANLYGDLAEDAVGLEVTEPVTVTGLPGPATEIATGGHHTCAISGDDVYCWGLNLFGQLGTEASELCGPFVCSTTPLLAVADSNAVAIAGGAHHTCILTSGGGVQCWGRGELGQLGNGMSVDSDEPVDVVVLDSGVTAIAAAYDHTCAALEGGGLRCWGANDFGQLGDGTTEASDVPVDVVGIEDEVAAVALGAVHTCAVLETSETRCWGNNIAGQLGYEGADSAVPLAVSGLRSKAVPTPTGIGSPDPTATPATEPGATATPTPGGPSALPNVGAGARSGGDSW